MQRFVSLVLGLAIGAASCAAPAPTAPAGPSEASGAAAASQPAAPDQSPATWIVTTAGTPFARSTVVPGAHPSSADVTVDAKKSLQVIEGFGGAFNEHGWDALSVLPEAERNAVLRELFDPVAGLRFNYCRTPIGASDYALDRYTLDEAPGDFAMAKFSIERDQKRLIPFLQAALKIRPDLRLWASAWTPPSWMKTNAAFDGGAMKDDPKVYAAYALYLAKYVESYKGVGIDISMLVPQNEPGQVTHYPSCDWTPPQYVSFIRDHLAPTLRSHNLPTKIFVGTINRDNWDVFGVLKDPGTMAVISGATFQWHGLVQIAKVHAEFPNLTLMQSETECGNTSHSPNYNPDTPPNDFLYAAYSFRKFRDFINGGASSYMLWNMVLDEHGKNIDSQRPWPQNSAIVVDRTTKRVTYTPLFWLTKHFSALVDAGAHLVETTGAYPDRIAFQNPDGTVVLELLNDTTDVVHLNVDVGGRQQPVELPPQSIASLLVPRG